MTQEVEKRTTVSTVTPSGIEIEYEPGPHTYRIRFPAGGDSPEGDGWKDAVSVSTVLDVLYKGGLTKWAERLAREAVIALWGTKLNKTNDGRLAVWVRGEWHYATAENLRDLIRSEKLDSDSVRDAGGDRGNSVHAAFETWCEDFTMPVPDFHPEEERGYIEGLRKFLVDVGQVKSKPESEVMVASYEHQFAGRFDATIVLQEANLITKPATPTWTAEGPNHHSAKAPVYTALSGRTLVDIKTPKSIYVTHHLQLSAYEQARLECGMPATKQQIVVRVGSDGTYEAALNKSTLEDYLSVLDTDARIRRLEKTK